MQVKYINSILSTLAALTSERDESAHELALVKSMTDLTATVHGELAKPVVIYSLKDNKKQLISTLSINGIVDNEIPDALRKIIIDCCTSGSIGYYKPADDIATKLYPLKSNSAETSNVISIKDPQTDEHLDNAVAMLLQIYKNFTNLINDNESDTLTGLLNRKTFDLKIGKTLAQMQSIAKRKRDKSDQLFFLAIYDIDHFKQVNDQFGHLIGDEVLLMFAQLMRQSVRESDPLYRFGGEEFVGLFECAKSTDINLILERFRQKVEQFNFPQVGKITVSTGYTEIQEFDTSSQIIDRADSALYFAKHNGRNQIACFEQLLADGLLEQTKKEGDIEFF